MEQSNLEGVQANTENIPHAGTHEEGKGKNANSDISDLASVLELPGGGEFNEGIKEKLTDMARDVIVGVNEGASGKDLTWRLEFFGPKSEKDMLVMQEKIYNESTKLEYSYNYPSQDLIEEALEHAGLTPESLYGGGRGTSAIPEEERNKAKRVLTELQLKAKGLLEIYTEGSANLTMNKVYQVGIITDGYVPKFGTKMELDAVIEYLKKQIQ